MSIRSSQDLLEIWNDVRKGTKTILWCNGLKEILSKSRKRKQANDSDVDSDDDAGKTTSKRKRFTPEAREKKVEETLSKLKEKHGNSFTQMQYHIRSEMIICSVHSSVDDPPNTSMFARAGGSSVHRKKSDSGFAESLADFVKHLSSALSPPTQQSNAIASRAASAGTSPAKSIDSRSKCYEQLSDLNNI